MNSQSVIADPGAWDRFLAELPAIKSENLNGDALSARLEAAWAPLFEGLDEDYCAQVYEDCVARLRLDGVVPDDWIA